MNTAAVDIRSACTGDAERLIQIHYEAVHAGAKDEYPSAVLDSWSPEPNQDRYVWMRNQIDGGCNHILVAETADGDVVGFCIFSADDGFIHAIYVAPERFGKGLGRRLLWSAEGFIAKAGTRSARLNASRNALEFYLAEGYQVIRPTTQTLADGTQMNCHEMSKTILAT